MNGKLSCVVHVGSLQGGGFFAFSTDLGHESVVWGESLESVRREAEDRVKDLIGYQLPYRCDRSDPVDVLFNHPELQTIAC